MPYAEIRRLYKLGYLRKAPSCLEGAFLYGFYSVILKNRIKEGMLFKNEDFLSVDKIFIRN